MTFLLINHCVLGNPAADPEIASGCINLAGKLIPRFLHTFFNPQVQADIPNLFIFSLRCLTTAEIMPKRAAATFWVNFLIFPSPPPRHSLSP